MSMGPSSSSSSSSLSSFTISFRSPLSTNKRRTTTQARQWSLVSTSPIRYIYYGSSSAHLRYHTLKTRLIDETQVGTPRFADTWNRWNNVNKIWFTGRANQGIKKASEVDTNQMQVCLTNKQQRNFQTKITSQ